MSSERGRTYYDILGIMPNATPQQIEDAYHFFSAQIANSHNVAMTKELQEAFITLSDPTKRAMYDRLLFGGTGTYQNFVATAQRVETFSANDPNSQFIMKQKQPQQQFPPNQQQYSVPQFRGPRRAPGSLFRPIWGPLEYFLIFLAVGLPVLTILAVILILILQSP